MTVLAQAATTQDHRLGGLNNIHVLLTVIGAQKPKMKVLASSVPGESPLPGLQTAVFSICPHVAKSRERDHLSYVSSYRGTNPIYEGSALMT